MATPSTTPTKGQPNTNYALDTNKISALVFLVPLQYLRNFSDYFDVMVDRVPGLVEKLRRLRLITKAVCCAQIDTPLLITMHLTSHLPALDHTSQPFYVLSPYTICARDYGP